MQNTALATQQTYMSNTCGGKHRFFVAETAASEGKVHVFALCTDCGEAIQRSFTVADSSVEILTENK